MPVSCWWEARYSGADVITANEIHVPVGKRLFVRLESADVIHCNRCRMDKGLSTMCLARGLQTAGLPNHSAVNKKRAAGAVGR